MFTPRLWSKAMAGITSLGLCVSASAETQAFQAAKDNTLFEDNQNYAGGASSFVFAGPIASGSPRRVLWQFDLSSIPPGSHVLSVNLRFVVNRAGSGSNPADVLRLHKLNASWGEGHSDAGAGGGGTQATPDDATWAYRFYGVAATGAGRVSWLTLGGDFAPNASASLNAGGAATYTFTSTPDLINDITVWINDPATNFGWILIGPEGPEHSQSAKRIVSRESPSIADRPTLTVEFMPPITPTPVPLLTNFGKLIFGILLTFTSIGISLRSESRPRQTGTDKLVPR